MNPENENARSNSKISVKQAYRKMFALARPEWKTLAWGTFFLIIGSGMGLAFPQAIRVIIDGALANGIQSINNAALAMVAIFLVQGIATGMRHYLFTIAGYRVVTDLQSTTFRHIIQQEIGFFDQHKTGEFMSRLSSDTTVLRNTVSVNISMGLRHFVSSIGGIALLIYTSPTLTLLMLAVVPPVTFATVWYGRKIRHLSKIVQDALAKASEVAEETLSGVRTVRAFTREDHESGRYRGAVVRAFEATRERTLSVSIFQGALTFAGFGAVAFVLWYGGRLVVAGDMSVGDLTSFILYTLLIAVSLGSLGQLWADFMRATGAAERIFELLDRTPLIPTSGGHPLPEVKGRLEFEKVCFSYPSRPDVAALEDISFTIEPGELVALVGPSGSGKSTIAHLIPRFYDPNSGHILLDGHDLTTLDPRTLREQIGTVAQEPVLFSTTIGENIGYGRRDADEEAIRQAAKIANAHDFIEAFPQGYQTEVGERGVRLSGGQKQRVAIARAVLKDPRILILDEATSALDAQSEFLVKEALDRLQQGRTTLIIAHRLSTVKDANRVMVIDGGRIVEIGRHEELMAREDGIYRNLVEHQFVMSSFS